MENKKSFAHATVVFSKIAKIVSIIVFWCSIVGAAGCALGLISMVPLANVVVEEGGRTFRELITAKATQNWSTIIVEMVYGMLLCGGAIVGAYFSKKHFTNELERGTAFTHEGGKELMILGAIHAGNWTVAVSIASVVGALVEYLTGEQISVNWASGTIWIEAIVLVVLGVYLRAAAEKLEVKKDIVE